MTSFLIQTLHSLLNLTVLPLCTYSLLNKLLGYRYYALNFGGISLQTYHNARPSGVNQQTRLKSL